MIEHLSYSQISEFLLCQESYRFKYIEEIPTVSNEALIFGSAWHKMISIAIQCRSIHFDHLWHDTICEYLPAGEHINEWPTSQLGFKMLSSTDILNTLTNLLPKYNSDGTPMIDMKIEFYVQNVLVPVIGYIDMIGTDGIPVDFKTAGRKWSQQQADNSLQPTFYLAGLHYAGLLKASDFPAKFRYIIFTKTKKPTVQIVETSRTAEDILILFDLISKCCKAIEHGNFLPSGIGSWKCSQKYCDFWHLCRFGG